MQKLIIFLHMLDEVYAQYDVKAFVSEGEMCGIRDYAFGA